MIKQKKILFSVGLLLCSLLVNAQTQHRPMINPGLLYALFAVLTIALLIWGKSTQIIREIKRAEAGEEPGVYPFYFSKKFVALVSIVFILSLGIVIATSAINLGTQTNYQPKQPIFFSHEVHAGINQINCLYCHGNAEKEKSATIPSMNVCMNCHNQIKEYIGPDLFDMEGKKIDGTAEIKKLLDMNAQGKNIEWVRVHNLAAFVYFSHEQHVKVGDQQCQTCHGNVQNMNEVKQVSNLTMGWCVNCHRTTAVNFENKFYDQFVQLHEDLKSGKIKQVTAEQVGGIDCQKCHY
ncbi:MAG: cytochrome c3 family protein [Chitinophagaceae bacterium]